MHFVRPQLGDPLALLPIRGPGSSLPVLLEGSVPGKLPGLAPVCVHLCVNTEGVPLHSGP